MLISHRHRFIYIKTVKTGGTSVEMALEPFAAPEGADLSAPRNTFMETEAGIIGARGKDIDKGEDSWWNHMAARDIRQRLPAETWEGYFKFCNVRNPWDKTVSAFHHTHPAIKDESKEAIVAGFRRWMAGKRNLMKDTRIYFMGGKPAVDDVIRYDRLQADLDRICDRLGLTGVELGGYKTDFRGSDRIPYQDYYDDPSREAVREAYFRDIAQFGWTFD